MDRHAEKMLQNAPVTFSRFMALACLEECEPCTQRALGEALGYTDAGASRAVASLKADGFVVAEADPTRPQRNVVRLTERGKETLKEYGTMLETEFRKALIDAKCDPEVLGQQLHSLSAVLSEKERGQK